jgi:hypothetical protein
VLSDGDLLRNLLGRYCDLMDAGDWEGVGALFAGGRLASDDGTVLAAGAEDVARFYREGTRLHGWSPRTKHLVTNTVITLRHDGDEAEVRSSYLVLQAVEGVLALQPIITGRYVDTFVRIAAGEWGWQERRFAVDLMGDLSEHLVYRL